MPEVLVVLFIIAIVAISRRRQWGPAQLADPAQTAELARLREEMDALAAQVVRLQDEQSFMMRLLTDGSGGRAAPPPPDSAAAPAAAQPGDAPNDDHA